MEIVKKTVTKNKQILKVKVKKGNYSEIFNQIRYTIKVEAVTAAKF